MCTLLIPLLIQKTEIPLSVYGTFIEKTYAPRMLMSNQHAPDPLLMYEAETLLFV